MPNETVAVPTTPEGVLCRAAEVIELRGWTTGDYGNDEGVCLVGACLSAIGVDPVTFDERNDLPLLVEEAVQRLAGQLDPGPCGVPATTVTEWNDGHCLDQTHAVLVLRAAAGGCKEAGGG